MSAVSGFPGLGAAGCPAGSLCSPGGRGEGENSEVESSGPAHVLVISSSEWELVRLLEEDDFLVKTVPFDMLLAKAIEELPNMLKVGEKAAVLVAVPNVAAQPSHGRSNHRGRH